MREVLVRYKELLLRFEALSRAVQEHLSCSGCSNSMVSHLKQDQQHCSLGSGSQTTADATDARPRKQSNDGGSGRSASPAHRQAAAAAEQSTVAGCTGASGAHQSEGGMQSCALGQSSPSSQSPQPAFFAASCGGTTGKSLEPPPAPEPLQTASGGR